ncbi:MAG: enoyl-CoA hydratase/isomerase family protein [Betaproteobacteria bacterium]|nr:enoyl-CoA hydratase/isomerase family protein [Betaproteobacteria bacterium]NBY04858.1 enoyl-CoA hydratase/isomerase family protein [Betaproteobacteria bacterium]
MSDVVTEVKSNIGLITLNRPKTLNALSLSMVRDLTACLLAWRDNPQVLAVAVRGSHKEGVFGHFCAGGDIRFFHQAALAGDPSLEDFFTEEYTLNHLVHTYPKPYMAFMDGIVMGGGMGLSQGAAFRLVTERTQMAMPETHIGLFPDVGGGYFLSRLAGSCGEFLGLTGQVLSGEEAVAVGLADGHAASHRLPALWEGLGQQSWRDGAAALQWLRAQVDTQAPAAPAWLHADMHRIFALPSMVQMLDALGEMASVPHPQAPWAHATLDVLRQRSALMLCVVLHQIRLARGMGLSDDLRMERNMVRHCFHGRPIADCETVEGIRARVVDKDKQPRWKPARVEDVNAEEVASFFVPPWPDHAHPLRGLR